VQCLLLGRLASAATCRAANSQLLQLSSSWYSQHLSAVLRCVLVLCHHLPALATLGNHGHTTVLLMAMLRCTWPDQCMLPAFLNAIAMAILPSEFRQLIGDWIDDNLVPHWPLLAQICKGLLCHTHASIGRQSAGSLARRQPLLLPCARSAQFVACFCWVWLEVLRCWLHHKRRAARHTRVRHCTLLQIQQHEQPLG
jgi:hypothetical protein